MLYAASSQESRLRGGWIATWDFGWRVRRMFRGLRYVRFRYENFREEQELLLTTATRFSRR